MGDWPFWLLGAATALGGLLLLYAGLFRDRSRGQRRCSQCWYDMSALPSRRCPECGHESPTEARLFRTRRRWRLAAIGVLAALGGAGTGLGPQVRRDGPLAIVPTTILLALAPQAGTEQTYPPGGGVKLHPIAAELKRRNAQEHMAAWQWRYYLRRSRAIEIPSRWVRGEQVYIRMQVPRWLDLVELTADTDPPCREQARAGQTCLPGCGLGVPKDWYEGYRLGPVLHDDRSSVALAVEVKTGAGRSPRTYLDQPRTLWKGRFSFPCRLTDSAGQIKRGVRSAELDAAFRSAAVVSAWVNPTREQVYWLNGRRGAPSGPVDVYADLRMDVSGTPLASLALGLSFALVRDGVAMKETAITARDLRDYAPGHLSAYIPLCATADDRPCMDDLAGLSRWALRIRGTPELALSDYDHDTCWTGQITIPLAEVLKQHR